MDATTEAAIGACDDVLAADYVGEPHDSVRHQLRMLQHVSSVADHARDDDLTIWQRCLLPHLPLVFVSRVASLDGIALRLHRLSRSSRADARLCFLHLSFSVMDVAKNK